MSFSVRIHGRGGQGVVTAAELLAAAAFGDGLESQAFPSFGSERMGAPVVAFCRVDERRIRLREPIVEPDAVVVQDPTLLHHVDVFGGLLADGYVLINSSRTIDELGLDELRGRHHPARLLSVPASEACPQTTRPADPKRGIAGCACRPHRPDLPVLARSGDCCALQRRRSAG